MYYLRSALLSTAFAVACTATTYDCANIDLPGAPSGINNAGVIVGSVLGAGGYIRDTGGNITTVNYPGGVGITRLYTINNNGVSVGFSGNGSPQSVIFTRDSSGVITTIPIPSYIKQIPMTLVYGINDAGAISGFDGSSFFILNPDRTTTPVAAPNLFGLGAPGSINNVSVMLETNVGGGGNAALSAPGTTPTPIPSVDPSGSGPFVFGLNNSGTTVGYVGHYLKAPPFGPPWTGFTREASGTFSSLVCTGLSNIQPFAINDYGIVVGADTAGFTNGFFLATPVTGSPQFNASVSSLDFGQVPDLQPSAPMTFVLSNSGNARMDIGGIRLKGEPQMITSPSFSASACMSQGAAVTSLDPGSSCVVTVRAVPSVPFPAPPGITLNDIILIDDSAPNSPHQIAVTAQTVASAPPPPPPSCLVSGYSQGPPRQVAFTLQDQVSGARSIVALNSINANGTVAPFAAGTTSTITATMAEIDPAKPSSLTFQITNNAGVTNACSAEIAGGADQWSGLGTSFNGKVAVVVNADALLEAFVRALDGSLLHSSQSLTDGSWSAWENLGGVMGSDPAVILNAANGLEVFAAGPDGSVWHTAQTAPYSGWTGWMPLGGAITGDPAVSRNADGRLEVFARGADSSLWHIFQTQPGGTWSGWISLGGYILSDPRIAAGYNDGLLEVFALGGDGALWQITQTTADSFNWSGWASLGSGQFTGNPAVAVNEEGFVEAFIRGADDSLWHNVQSVGGDQVWSGWTSLGGDLTSDPAVSINNDGRLDVFGRGTDNALWHSAQTIVDGPWSGWTGLGGYLGADVNAIVNPNSRMEVYAQAGDGTLWHIAQVYSGNWN